MASDGLWLGLPVECLAQRTASEGLSFLSESRDALNEALALRCFLRLPRTRKACNEIIVAARPSMKAGTA